MICDKCGSKVEDGISICPTCGKEFQDENRTIVLEEDDHTVALWDEGVQNQEPKRIEPKDFQKVSEDSCICPNCHTQNAKGDLFCLKCGALMQSDMQTVSTQNQQAYQTQPQNQMNYHVNIPQTPAMNGQNTKPPKPPKMNGDKNNKKLIMAFVIGIVTIVVVALLFVGIKAFWGNRNSAKDSYKHLCYMKDNEVYVQVGNKDPYVIINRLFAESDEAKNAEPTPYLNALTYAEDGKTVFYIKNITARGLLSYEGSFYCNVLGTNKEEVKIDSNVSSFKVLSPKSVIYLKDDKLYINDMKEKQKIASDVSSFVLSSDKKYVLWNTNDSEERKTYIQKLDMKSDKIKIDTDISIVCKNDNLSSILYTKDGNLYSFSNYTTKEKVASDVVDTFYVNDSLLYVKYEEEEAFTLYDFVRDDLESGYDYVKERFENYKLNVYPMKIYRYEQEKNESVEIYSGCGSLLTIDMVHFIIDIDLDDLDLKRLTKLSELYMDEAYNEIWNDVVEESKFCIIKDKEILECKAIKEAYYDDDEKTDFMARSDFENEFLYYALGRDNDENKELYKVSIATENAAEELICDDFYSFLSFENESCYFTDYHERDNRGSEATLNINANSIDYDVSVYDVKLYGDRILFFKDMSSRNCTATLYEYKNGKVTKIADDVLYDSQGIITGDKISYLADYSQKGNSSDLYVYDGKKATQIDTDVTSIYYN